MARYGAKSPLWSPIATEPDKANPTYGTGITIGKLVSCGVTPNYSEGSLAADNTTAEYAKEIKDQDIALETDDLVASNAVALYGAKFNGNDVEYNSADNPPYGGYATSLSGHRRITAPCPWGRLISTTDRSTR